MKRAEMRIVGLNRDNIFIQRKTGKYYENPWVQTIMSFDEFFKMMATEFSDYYEKYTGTDNGYEKANFFYEYNYSEKETFIYR